MRKQKLFSVFLTLFLLLALSCYIKHIDIKTEELRDKTNAYCATFTTNSQEVEPVTVIQYAAPFSYGLQYPQTGQSEIDKRIVEIVDEIRSSFEKEYANTDNTVNIQKYSSDITLFLNYETYIFSVSHLSLLFYETHEINGVPSVTRIHTYHFDLRQNEEQSAEDLMYKGFLESASSYAQKYFRESDLYKEDLFDNYQEILANDENLFKRFALTSEGVLFFIDSNVILPDSYGMVRFAVPYNDMQSQILTGIDAEAKLTHAINPQKPMVALTFDDGPNPVYTNIILDTLGEYNVVATFFNVGYMMEVYPAISQHALALGCEICSHSYDHKDFTTLTDAEIEKDIEEMSEIFCSILEQEPTCFRPPYGSTDQRVEKLIPMPLILWSLDTRDWESRNSKAVMSTIKEAGDLDGKVILMHCTHESSAEATALLIPYLLDEGYQLVTISEMIELRYNEVPQNGKLYGYRYFQ